MLPGKSPHTEKPRGEEQDPYLWSSQSEGLSAGQRHGGWPLRGPSHVLGDRWGQMSSGLAQCSSQVSDPVGNHLPQSWSVTNGSALPSYYVAETPGKRASAGWGTGSHSDDMRGSELQL